MSRSQPFYHPLRYSLPFALCSALLFLSAQAVAADYPLLLDERLELNGGARIDGSDGLAVAINSDERRAVQLNGGARINGDLHIGPGADADQVVELRGGARISGNIAELAQTIPLPQTSAPQISTRREKLELKHGSYRLDSDLRIKEFKLSGSARLIISGSVQLRVDEEAKFEGSGAVELEPGASLALFVGDELKISGAAQLNRGGSASDLRIVVFGDDEIKIEGGTRTVAAISAARGELKMGGSAELRGGFAGQRAELSGGSLLQLDAAASFSGDATIGENTSEATVLRVEHDGAGIHCAAEPIGLRVLDASGNPLADFDGEVLLDTGSGRGDWQLGGARGSLQNLGDGRARYQFAASENGIARLALDYREGGEALDIAACIDSLCDDDSAGALRFAASGFTVTASQLSNPPPTLINDPLGAQTAGDVFALHITAFGSTPDDPTCGVIESYRGTQQIALWLERHNPVSGSVSATADGQPIADSENAASAQAVQFSAGQAQIALRYADVGQVRIGLRDAADASRRGGSQPFVVRPAQLRLLALRDDGAANPQAENASGEVFVAAGQSFALMLDALASDGQRTPNFGAESPAETLTVSHSLLAPNGGATGVLDGDLQHSGGGHFSGEFSFSEIGIIALSAALADGDYLGSGPLTAAEQRVGRFVPAALRIDEIEHGALQSACAAGGFSYAGQPFGYALAPNFVVSGRNAGGELTANYRGDFAKLDASSATLPAVTADALTLGADGNTPLAIAQTTAPLALTDLGDGRHRFTLGDDQFVYLREPNALVGGFSAAPDRAIAALRDGDGVSADIDALAPPMLRPRGAAIRYGRLLLGSAHGSELQPLSLPLRAEVFDAAAGSFVPQRDDQCTAGLAASAVDVSASDALDAGDLTLSLRQPTIDGQLDLQITAPGVTGSARIELIAPSWLSPVNPATATFGIASGRASFIYQREVR